jgi:hypothetical protein
VRETPSAPPRLFREEAQAVRQLVAARMVSRAMSNIKMLGV